MYEYLKAYAEKFSLVERMRLGMRISHISRNVDNRAWDVEIEHSKEVLTCDKLIVATGLNSKPNWPDIQLKDYDGLIIHSKDIGLRYQELISKRSTASRYMGVASQQ